MFKIYTDGSCDATTRIGGWGYIMLKDKEIIKEKNGGKLDSTNNRMELYAIIKGIKYVKKHYPDEEVEVYTDSLITMNCANGKFKRNANLDLWEVYDQVVSGLKIKFVKIKAHSGDFYNERVDILAKEGCKKAT